MRPCEEGLSMHPKNRRRGKCRERLAFQDMVNAMKDETDP
jgi:hypothetical protein